jgi:hypothetical protein
MSTFYLYGNELGVRAQEDKPLESSKNLLVHPVKTVLIVAQHLIIIAQKKNAHSDAIFQNLLAHQAEVV